ncbi:MAG: indole-3-glycerol phosphate synthase TrpC [Oscillospiraceae bacterium]|nr:indole-3-glycerol phosphate synthase TrpC [Oscillospiraceae bacterium]
MILDTIIESTKKRVARQKEIITPRELIKKAERSEYRPLGFGKSLTGFDGISIIAEIKKASPSKGLIRPDFNHTDIANDYKKADIQAISVLTEPEFFKGELSFVKDIREITDIPVLRKDFIIDEYQIYEALVNGASAVLLIMAALDDKTFEKFYKCAHELGLDCLVETHNKEEVIRAEGADIIGVNNRDLATFEEDITTVERLMPFIRGNTAIIAESAIRTHKDFEYLQSLGVDGALVGEAFMREASPCEAVKKLRFGG